MLPRRGEVGAPRVGGAHCRVGCGGLDRASDPLGNRTSYTWNAFQGQTARIDPLGFRWTSVYDGMNQPIASIDPLGNISTTVFDAAGRLIASIDALGRVSTRVYDTAGGPIASVAPTGLTSTTVYDGKSGRVDGATPAPAPARKGGRHGSRTRLLRLRPGRQAALYQARNHALPPRRSIRLGSQPVGRGAGRDGGIIA